MEGGAEEIYYYYDEQTKKITQVRESPSSSEFSLSHVLKGDSHKHAVGVVGHIRDEVALHVVRYLLALLLLPLSQVRPFAGMSACTLHVYSKPIAVCKIYCAETGTVRDLHLTFFSFFQYFISTRFALTSTSCSVLTRVRSLSAPAASTPSLARSSSKETQISIGSCCQTSLLPHHADLFQRSLCSDPRKSSREVDA